MPNLIQILPPNISNQIAAGEVVQRPASVVKELIENAIDAKATHIQLNIKDAGKTLIQVIDNGTGMNEEDALISFERHATSKIKTSEDLFHLTTMGFRGEALASIAAIAHVEMKTKQENQELGTFVEMEGNVCKNKTPIACEKGTSISVKNLFYNVPARRNFLKTDPIENNHILEEFIRTALINNDIAFTYYNNGKLIHKLDKQNLKKRIIDLFGKAYNERLLPIEEEIDAVKISGFIIKAEYVKKNKSEQYFFVNNRYMRNTYLANSIDRAYQGMIQEKTYPAFFIHLNLNPENIDVNIHPTKTEIKFLDDKVIYAVLYAAAKKSLGQFTLINQLDFSLDSSFEFTPLKKGEMPTMPRTNFNPDYNPFEKETTNKISYPKQEDIFEDKGVNIFTIEESFKTNYSNNNPEVIQFLNKYIITKTKNNILIINQERASQRILYDKFSSMDFADISCQQLLFPYNHFFSPTHTTQLLELLPDIRKYGFAIEYQKDGSFNITATPNEMNSDDAQIILEDLLFELNQTNFNSPSPKSQKIALTMAKRLSIKEGKQLQDEEMLGIVGQLFSSSSCEISPFGKKIIHKLDMEEIDNIFG
ncbi:MAG: DNA mismatch repair endonuclease MutL [Bacteroidaceae bacterium]|nr:DNA mismatch repair endonuclease MutL [Bacteroidaceae bacterium]